MVIDTNNSINPGAAGANRGRSSSLSGAAANSKAPEAAGTQPEAGSKDKVVLSSEAQNLNRLQAKISDMPDVDMGKVNAIKKALAEGKFEINAERIAENMLKQDELLS